MPTPAIDIRTRVDELDDVVVGAGYAKRTGTTVEFGSIPIGDLPLRNQPNGYAGLDENGELLGPIIVRRDTDANLAALVLSAGELAVVSDTEELRVGDGVTLGGQMAAGWRQRTITLAQSGGNTLLPIPSNGERMTVIGGSGVIFLNFFDWVQVTRAGLKFTMFLRPPNGATYSLNLQSPDLIFRFANADGSSSYLTDCDIRCVGAATPELFEFDFEFLDPNHIDGPYWAVTSKRLVVV